MPLKCATVVWDLLGHTAYNGSQQKLLYCRIFNTAISITEKNIVIVWLANKHYNSISYVTGVCYTCQRINK